MSAAKRDEALGPKGPLGSTPARAGDPQNLRRRGVLLAAGLAGLLVCVIVLGTIAEVVRTQGGDPLDAFATPFLHGLATPWLDAVMNAATFVGSDFSIVPLAVAIGAWLAWVGRRREAAFLAVSLGGSLVVNYAMKVFFHRARPALPWAHVLPDYSFPSGHTMNSLAFGLALALIVWRLRGPRWGAPAIGLAVLASLVIATSRVYLGYHYLTDVIGGFAAAILWVAIAVGVFRARGAWLPSRARGERATGERAT